MDIKELIISVAKAYNKLDHVEIESLLADEVVYENQGVLVKGKVEVIGDMKAKFGDLRKSGRKVFAELAVLPPGKAGNRGDEIMPCMILSQAVQTNRVAVILVSSKNGLIDRIEIRTSEPHWTQAQGSGLFPGIS